MPIIKSEKKSLRQNKTRRERNLTYLNKMRLLLKAERELIAKGNKKDAEVMLPRIYKALDKAVKENVIKKNTAARRKARITKAVNQITTK